MKDSSYQHVCTLILGLATMFRQAVKEISTILATFIVPVVLNYVSSKWTLVIGNSLFACYFLCFFFLNDFVFFAASVLFGIGTAGKFQLTADCVLYLFTVIYTSHSTMQMIFFTRKSLPRNVARVWGIANLSSIFGGVMYITITSTHVNESIDAAQKFRYYSDSESRTLCGCLLACCLINLALTSAIPTREVENSVASENPREKLELRPQMYSSLTTLLHPSIIIFVPRFLNHGLLVAFFLNVYPTSLQYSAILAQKYPMMTAYYGFALCAGAMFCSFFVSYMNRLFQLFALRPLTYILNGVLLLAYFIAFLTVPNLSTARPTAESALFEPHLIWVFLVGFLLGFADTAYAASSSEIYTRILPGCTSHTYSAARFYQGISATAIFFLSPLLTMKYHAIVLASVTLLSIVSFDFAVKQIEKKTENEAPNTKRNDD